MNKSTKLFPDKILLMILSSSKETRTKFFLLISVILFKCRSLSGTSCNLAEKLVESLVEGSSMNIESVGKKLLLIESVEKITSKTKSVYCFQNKQNLNISIELQSILIFYSKFSI